MNAVIDVETAVILGGNSDIGLSTARLLLKQGTRKVILAGRDTTRLEAAAADLRSHGAATVEVVSFDAAATETHADLVDDLFERGGDIDLVLLAFGILGDQQRGEEDAAAAIEVLRVNFEGAVSVGVPLMRRLRGQGHGHLVLLSSVAAERPRRGNFVYGASKAGVDAFFQGLADSAEGTGVHVMVVRPGRVRTKMTEGMPEIPFTTDTDVVARDIVAGLRRRAHTVWSPPIMRVVMFGMRHLPRGVFRKVGERG
ncbi:MAG: decaprenylphospho-beta-D-erythro-pentofuranosid-2-ulose 2-reductase [Chloroflexota bacterium]|nr:decaprenylphospho-beta-D-erythro-pentofuranosid-2-ulose 2-reductase [Chloroflexota bacterium]